MKQADAQESVEQPSATPMPCAHISTILQTEIDDD